MAHVGRSFGFYIQYWTQMYELHQSDDRESLVTELSSAEQDLVDEVIRCASEQAVSLLGECATNLQTQFRDICDTRRVTTPERAARDWFIDLAIWPKGTQRLKSNRWTVGFWD